MASIIQGLTQSPIVQKLSETEHHVKRFTHDIPDNAPLRSFSKVEVGPYVGNDHPNSTNRFKIARNGYLNRMYLKVDLRSKASFIKFLSGIENKHNDFLSARGPEFFANFFNSASLVIGGKTVETLYPENVMLSVFQSDGGVGENLMLGLRGHLNVNGDYGVGNSALPLDSSASEADYGFFIPLDFSIMKFYKDALDTNFLNKMEIVFEKREMLTYQELSAFPKDNTTKVSLVCMYHNVHNHFKNQIRNTNFKKESSTLLTNNNYLVTELPQRVNVGQQESGYPAFARHTYDLQLDMFATDILITFRKEIFFDEDITTTNGEVQPTPIKQGILRFKLLANDRVLYDKFHYEVERERDPPSSLDVQDQSLAVKSKTAYDIGGYAFGRNRVYGDTMIDHRILEKSDYDRNASSMYRIPLTLFGSDEFLNGGLDLKSLTNVKLIIECDDFLVALPGDDDRKSFISHIVIRHKTITRIDGKTGNVVVA